MKRIKMTINGEINIETTTNQERKNQNHYRSIKSQIKQNQNQPPSLITASWYFPSEFARDLLPKYFKHNNSKASFNN